MSTSAFAKTVDSAKNMCKYMSDYCYGAAADLCYNTTNNKIYKDKDALSICNRAVKRNYFSIGINCLAIIANKEFEKHRKMNICLNLSGRGYLQRSIDCLKGISYKRITPSKNNSDSALVKTIKEAIISLEKEESNEAEHILPRAIEAVN